MDPDLLLVIGLCLAAFSVPAVLSAVADGRAPRAPALTILIAGGMVLYALNSRPGGYTLSDVPEAFVRVIAGLLN